MGRGVEQAQGGTAAGMRMGDASLKGGIGLTTLSTCARGSWVSFWGSGKPVQTPQTERHCPGPCQERRQHKAGHTMPLAAAMGPGWTPAQPSSTHPLAQVCPPKACWCQHPKGCPLYFAWHHQLRGRLAPTIIPPPFWGQPVPVMLWGMFICQHLQVDGLGSPLDAPVLQGRKVPTGKPDGASWVLAPTRAQMPFWLLGY